MKTNTTVAPYKITSGIWNAVIYPAYGACLMELSCGGQAILRSPQNENELKSNPHLYGNPILLPPNRTEDGTFLFAGRSYSLPVNEPEKHNHIHGLFYNAPFVVTKSTVNEIWCSYHNHHERYPFPCTISFHYIIGDEGLHIDISIRNDGRLTMPLILGFHTTFVEPATFAVPIRMRWERDERFLPTGRLLPLNTEEEQIKTGSSYRKKLLSGYYTAGGHRVRIGDFIMETSEGFNQWVLYNGGGEGGYLCVEPQTGPVNGLNIPGGAQILEAGEEASYWLRFAAGNGQ